MLHSYHYTLVEQLLPQILPARLQFAQFLQNMQTKNPDFLNKILLPTRRHLLGGEFLIGETIYCGIPRIHMLRCATRIKKRHVYTDIYMSIFLIGGLTVEVNLLLPPRSPDLNPLDLSVWSNLKELVYGEEVNSLQELQQRIQEAANTFKNNREILFNIHSRDI
ncbi:hypothetical protein NQ318_018168 [Aromia moschata]|uniref:Uncharacterized protein n=1 Tax=Aromia moschata TaxID=1265417 RepID=A0AAV8ZDD2_9CUCU|nr:hypothetical protein NQ318_018168 [Aromia moschata]